MIAPATTATDSIFAACRTLGLKCVAAISPYLEAVDEAEHRFFADQQRSSFCGWNSSPADGGVRDRASLCIGRGRPQTTLAN